MLKLSKSTKKSRISSSLFTLTDYSNEIFDSSLSIPEVEDDSHPHDVFQVIKVPLFVETVCTSLVPFRLLHTTHYLVPPLWSIISIR
jgi:hypothetical protein